MSDIPYLVILGALVAFAGTLGYIKATLTGRAKPNRVSWFLWMVAPMIGTAAALAKGVTWAVLPVFMAGFGPLLILLASFVNKKAYWKLETFDYLCGVFSILALILWGITNEPNIAIFFAILSDGFATIPTLKKCWKYPKTEVSWAYATSLFSVLTGFTAVSLWTFAEIAFPIYLIVANIAILAFIYRDKLWEF